MNRLGPEDYQSNRHIRKILQLALASSKDIFYDLGCGKGQLCVVAVAEFGVKRAVGIEMHRGRAAKAAKRVHELGLADRIEIRNEDFNGNARNFLVDQTYDLREDRRASIVALIAIDGSDNGMLDTHLLNGTGYSGRFTGVGGERLSCCDAAEPAGTGADVAQNHECGGATIPALSHVRAGRAFANGVQTEAADKLLQVAIVSAGRGGRAQPLGTFGRGGDGNQH